MDFPIVLPEYWIRPQVYFVYSNGMEKPGENWQIFEAEIDMEPTGENALLLLENVPAVYRGSVDYVAFQREQPLQKVRYGQGELADDGRLYVGLMEFSIAQTHVWLREVNRVDGKLLAKPVLKRGTSRMRETERVYIK